MNHIILIEDDPAIRDSLSIYFQSLNIKLTTYHSGEQILKNNFEPPQLFLLDKQLSGIDGLDVCKYIKTQESTKHIPVIMMSASIGIAGLAKEAGADDFIIKPYKLPDLMQTVGKFLG
jgi:CheY-like chemotaxis protein